MFNQSTSVSVNQYNKGSSNRSRSRSKRKNSKKKLGFAPIGSKQFKNIPFKEQLYVYSLYLNDHDHYRELIGKSPLYLEYIDKNILSLLQEKIGLPDKKKDAPAFYFVENHWTASGF